MTHLAWTILILILLDALLQIIGRHLNRASLEHPLPQRFSEIYDPREYRRHQHYLAEGMKLSQLTELFDLILLIGFGLMGGFAWLDGWVQQVTVHPVPAGLLFFGILALAKVILDMPFTLYRTFGIEARYGFNRTSPGTFILDLLKGLMLSVILGVFLGGGLLWILNDFGPQYWWLCWLFWIGFSLVLQYAAPRWIMPWFNTFEPLEEGVLKQRIEKYARTINFPLKQIFVMDGSRRSAKSNAFFTGYGRHRRIVLFDTLIEKHPLPELLAILAHEMGHFKLRHILKGMFLSYGTSGLFLFGLALAMTWQPLLVA
ncbi:MAG: M48 family metallopeptidase, partial [Desulfobacterales bacterium]